MCLILDLALEVLYLCVSRVVLVSQCHPKKVLEKLNTKQNMQTGMQMFLIHIDVLNKYC